MALLCPGAVDYSLWESAFAHHSFCRVVCGFLHTLSARCHAGLVCPSGDNFCWRCLRAAMQATTVVPTMCLTLDRRTFSRVMGPLQEVLKVRVACRRVTDAYCVCCVSRCTHRVSALAESHAPKSRTPITWCVCAFSQRNMATYGAVMAKLEES